jgi:hypothetical protein
MYKMGWATFWAIFSQTHLVTLLMATKRLPRLILATAFHGFGQGDKMSL